MLALIYPNLFVPPDLAVLNIVFFLFHGLKLWLGPYFTMVMKNSCKRPGCCFAVTRGMQRDKYKGRFRELCTDLMATYNRLSKSDHIHMQHE